MGWFGNRLMRGAANRALQRLAAEYGPGPGPGTLAIALGHACYPTATYGDNSDLDDMVTQLKQFATRPCNAQSACKYVEQWLDFGTLTTSDVFQRVWSLDPDTFLVQFFDSME